MTYDELKDRWETLEKKDQSFVLVDALHHIDINIGYSNNCKKTLLIVNSGFIPNLPESKAIKLENYEVPNSTTWVLSFYLIDEDKEELFIRVCWDLIESSRQVTENEVDFIINRYLKWLELMAYQHPDILPEARQKGLLGELLHLQSLIPKLGRKEAVDSWCGANWAAKDFEHGDTWEEIKAIKKSATNIEISSIEQLDSPSSGYLIVYNIDKTTPVNDYGYTLPDAIKKVYTLLNDDCLAVANFSMKLYQYGYSENPKYNNFKYLIGNVAKYTVNAEFPRISRTILSPAISNAKYSISVAAIDDYKVSDEHDN